jgi:hypothetical protein
MRAYETWRGSIGQGDRDSRWENLTNENRNAWRRIVLAVLEIPEDKLPDDCMEVESE